MKRARCVGESWAGAMGRWAGAQGGMGHAAWGVRHGVCGGVLSALLLYPYTTLRCTHRSSSRSSKWWQIRSPKREM